MNFSELPSIFQFLRHTIFMDRIRNTKRVSRILCVKASFTRTRLQLNSRSVAENRSQISCQCSLSSLYTLPLLQYQPYISQYFIDLMHAPLSLSLSLAIGLSFRESISDAAMHKPLCETKLIAVELLIKRKKSPLLYLSVYTLLPSWVVKSCESTNER